MSHALQFAALADETRCRMVEMLAAQPLAVHALAGAFAISRPAVSRHLRVLKDAGLVVEHRRGRENVYSLRRQDLRRLGGWLERHGQGRPGGARIAAGATQMELDF